MDDSGDQEIDGLYARLCHIEQYIPENNKDVYYGIHDAILEIIADTKALDTPWTRNIILERMHHYGQTHAELHAGVNSLEFFESYYEAYVGMDTFTQRQSHQLRTIMHDAVSMIHRRICSFVDQ